ncbi:MAG TPA: hypothetical protein VN513_06410 [Gemmatimonadales bacterium]|nr:hypothetical protein [Gemmatimonadales bacterium]
MPTDETLHRNAMIQEVIEEVRERREREVEGLNDTAAVEVLDGLLEYLAELALQSV